MDEPAPYSADWSQYEATQDGGTNPCCVDVSCRYQLFDDRIGPITNGAAGVEDDAQGVITRGFCGSCNVRGQGRIVLPPTSAANRSQIEHAIDALRTRGGTAMGAGVDIAYDLAQKGYREGIENRVVILSDGDANIGPLSHEALLNRISSYANQGITLSTIGFGRGNYQDTLMEQFANKGDGNAFYVDSDREAQRVFGARLVSTLQTVARDVKFQVVFNPEAVMAYRLIGYENREVADKDFRNDAVDAGEVGVGHSVTALYELVLRDAPNGDVAQVHIRHKVPGKDTAAVESSYAIPQTMVQDEWADVSDSYRVALAGVLRGKVTGLPICGRIATQTSQPYWKESTRGERWRKTSCYPSFVKQTSWRIPCVDRSRVR